MALKSVLAMAERETISKERLLQAQASVSAIVSATVDVTACGRPAMALVSDDGL